MVIASIKISCTGPANTHLYIITSPPQSLLLRVLCWHKHVEKVTGAKMLFYIYFHTNLQNLPNDFQLALQQMTLDCRWSCSGCNGESEWKKKTLIKFPWDEATRVRIHYIISMYKVELHKMLSHVTDKLLWIFFVSTKIKLLS